LLVVTLVLNAGNEHEFDAAFATIDRRTGALLFASDPFFVTWRNKLVALTASHQIPAIYYLREFAEAGGLMAYGNGLSEVAPRRTYTALFQIRSRASRAPALLRIPGK
jgi:hypothetical protein